MKMKRNWQSFACGSMLGILALAAGAFGWQARRTATDAAAAERTLAECRQLATEIRALDDGPAKAELAQRPVEELTQLVETWAKQVGIEADNLLRVEPHAPRRVGDTDYLEQGAKVELRDVSLLQLAQFADCVASAEDQLRVTDLRLTAPRQESIEHSGEETWQAELVLASLVYAPRSATR